MPEDSAAQPGSNNTIGSALRKATIDFQATSDTPQADAVALLSHCVGLDHAQLITHSDRPLDRIQASRFGSAYHRRLLGEPVAYIVGVRDFWTVSLEVDQHTLIPRPDTEILVEQALAKLPVDKQATLLDLGTGTGAVAVSIALERPHCTVVATDISEQALDVARRNALRANASVKFLQGDWLMALESQRDVVPGSRFDMIVSNPPYIADSDPHLTQGDLRFEPRSALVSGADGLDSIRNIARDARRWLAPQGWLMLEHGYDQAHSVAALLRQHEYNSVSTIEDLGGNARVTFGQKD